MRKLSREYGYAALGVYLALTALDLPFCYLGVSYLGTERIGHWEHVVLSYVKGLLKWPMGEEGKERVEEAANYVKRKVPLEDVREGDGQGVGKRLLEEEETYVLEDHGVTEAEMADSGEKGSMCSPIYPYPYTRTLSLYPSMRSFHNRKVTQADICIFIVSRCLDKTRARICDPQILHLHSSPPHSSSDPKGGQDVKKLGLEHWKAAAEKGPHCHRHQYRQNRGEAGEMSDCAPT